jgi:transcription initiation factor TFIIIB Brf1 subunit/transcription initiation factor TFIIB
MACEECGSQRLKADSNKTVCLKCGHEQQSGLQKLAQRFEL